jgi:Metallopeptidase family M24
MHGAEGIAYTPIVASGPDACTIHYSRNDKVRSCVATKRQVLGNTITYSYAPSAPASKLDLHTRRS